MIPIKDRNPSGIVAWVVYGLIGGAASIGVSFAHGGVAYWAHIGGFVAGVVLIKVLPRARPKEMFVRSEPPRGGAFRW